MSKDDRLREQVLDELRWDPSVDATHIGVAVNSGVVSLTGHVKTVAEKHAAEEAVTRVKGVRGVAEELTVQLPSDLRITDEDIAAAAVNRLAWDVSIPKEAIKVEVEQGWLTLVGTVDWHYQRVAAENAVRFLSGITGVTNRITIRARVNAESLNDDIIHALHRSWFFDPKTIRVTVDGGTVHLDGTVRSMHERKVAAATAWAAEGVTAVENELTVE